VARVIDYEDLAAYQINTGRATPFQSGPGADSALNVDVFNVWAGLVWQGDSAAAVRSASQLARWASSEKDSTTGQFRSMGYFAAGLWAFNHGDTAGVERARAFLARLRAAPKTPTMIDTPTIFDKVLAAHLAVARKTPDARAKL